MTLNISFKTTLYKILIATLLIIAIGITGCNDVEQTPSESQKLTIYSQRHYPADKKLIEMFEAKTGIKIDWVKGKADELIRRIETEGELSPADMLITVDAGRLWRAREKGLLQPVTTPALTANIPAGLRHPEGYWYGLTRRARVIVYAKDRVDPASLSSFEDLSTSKWKGKILVRSSNSIYNQSLLASLIAAHGEAEAKNWVDGLVSNFARAPKGNDRDQARAVAAGIGDIAIVNSYYIGMLYNAGDAGDKVVSEKIGIFFPNQEGRGTHTNASAAGITRHAKNKANAIKFLEFMTSREGQQVFADVNYEYAANPAVPPSELFKSWGTFKADPVNLELLGVHNTAAVKIMDEAGWQ